MIELVVVDDHAIFRESVRALLEADRKMKVIAEASSGAEVVDLVRVYRPDLTLLDVSMPGQSGLEALVELKQFDAGAKVLILTARPEDSFALRCLRAGADGYLTKQQAGLVLLEAVRRICSGGKYVSPDLAGLLVSEVCDEVSVAAEVLSDREFEVLCMVGSGKSFKRIAAELCLSPKTIATYRSRVGQKLHLRTTADLVRFALQENLCL